MRLPGFDGQARGREAAVDQVGPALGLRQLALDDADQAVQVGGGEVGHGPLEQRPDALSRFVTVHGSLHERLLAHRLSAGRACCGWWSGPGRYEHAILREAGRRGPVRARASSPDGGADECSGRGAVGVVSGGEPERDSGIAGHAPGAVGGVGRAGGRRDRG